jgi:hypothetical protein
MKGILEGPFTCAETEPPGKSSLMDDMKRLAKERANAGAEYHALVKQVAEQWGKPDPENIEHWAERLSKVLCQLND